VYFSKSPLPEKENKEKKKMSLAHGGGSATGVNGHDDSVLLIKFLTRRSLSQQNALKLAATSAWRRLTTSVDATGVAWVQQSIYSAP